VLSGASVALAHQIELEDAAVVVVVAVTNGFAGIVEIHFIQQQEQTHPLPQLGQIPRGQDRRLDRAMRMRQAKPGALEHREQGLAHIAICSVV